ncbi:hypothetical protein IV102_19345 [bacterium]|nr:hypothetical protein [bacterium]
MSFFRNAAQRNEGRPIQPVDLWQTLDNLEFHLITHATGLDRTYARLAQGMVDQFSSKARQL